jgi:HAMP domain-containing protein
VKLLTKALLVTSTAITVLLGVTGWLVQSYALRTTRQGLEEEVRASLSAYESLWRSRAEMLRALSSVISSMSDVRAAFSTGDELTIRDTAAELWSRISRDDAVFLVTDPTGHVIASLAGATQIPDLPIVPAAAGKFPNQAMGFMRTGEQLYQVVVTPVYVQAQHGPALINVLVAGYPVTRTLAAGLKQSTGSDFVYRSGGQTLVSTLGEDANAKLSSGSLPSSDYAVLTTPLISVDGQPLGELLIVRSFEIARRHLSALRSDLLMIWAIAVAAGVFLSYFLTRRIVDPIVRLNQAATAVAGRNYDSRVPVEGQDELGRLAQTFNSMCESIKEARKDTRYGSRALEALVLRLWSKLSWPGRYRPCFGTGYPDNGEGPCIPGISTALPRKPPPLDRIRQEPNGI